jgi:HK97 family phage major capsid protein
MPTLAELQTLRDTKSAELGKIFEDAKTGEKDPVTGSFTYDLAKISIAPDEIKKRNDELTELGKKVDEAKAVDEVYQKTLLEVKALHQPTNRFGGGDPGAGGGHDITQRDYLLHATKTFEKAFTESPSYKSFADENSPTWKQPANIKIEGSVKTLLQTSAGYLPPTLADTRVILSPQRRIVVPDLIPQDDTQQQFIPFIVETTFTNAAAATAEGAAKPEATLVFTRKVAQMQKVAVTLPVTQEQMMYIPQIEALLRNRLGLMVMLEYEREILNGSGVLPEQAGFLNTVGIQTQAQGADDVFTAIYKAITKVRSTVGFADPTGFVVHPNNWLTMRTIKDTVGRFILGDPSDVGPERIWGLPVVPTIAEPAGTGLIGDFQMYSHLDLAMGLTLQIGYINDDFIKNIVRLLAEIYFALEVYRPVAFCTITGLS